MLKLRRLSRACILCGAVIFEPFCHAFGIPHPEGLSIQVANLFATSETP